MSVRSTEQPVDWYDWGICRNIIKNRDKAVFALRKKERLIQRVPHYYKAFHCIASDCRDNCCVGGWEIDIDEETAQYYLSMEGEFGDRLRNSITRTDEYCFRLKDGKCPFLTAKVCVRFIRWCLVKINGCCLCTQFPLYGILRRGKKKTGIDLPVKKPQELSVRIRKHLHLTRNDFEEEVSGMRNLMHHWQSSFFCAQSDI